MMQYKVFYKDTEVANFETLKAATSYIYSILIIDKDLKIKDFNIYSKID